MAAPSDTRNLALFCDFENVALGVREARYEKFDINKVLERLLLKGSIVVKKAYCDWERYKEFRPAMHYASFELIEVPHVSQSGKNSADIRMVVDALDLCYTKAHVDTFVIISGDSDFSPLVSKLRENNKTVIGVGVKSSTSQLLIANCDEFIYYDDLVRAQSSRKPRKKAAAKQPEAAAPEAPAPAGASAAPSDTSRRRGRAGAKKKGAAGSEDRPPKSDEDKRQEVFDLVLATVEALIAERGEDEKLWGSMVKQALKRRNPGFNESYYGFKSFNALLEAAQAAGLVTLQDDEKSGGYLVKASG